MPNRSGADRRRRGNVTPSLYDIEEDLNVFVIGLYQKDRRGYRNWRQRALLVTLLDEKSVKDDVNLLADKITELEGSDDPYYTEVIPEAAFITTTRESRPQDSAVISISSPLVIAKRSPKTGKYYWTEEYEFCPEKGVPLRYVIQSSSNGQGICPELTQQRVKGSSVT